MFLSDPIYVGAMIRSFVVALTSAGLAMLLGVPAAFVMARQRMRGKGVVFACILAPVIIPHIIIAVALFYAFAQVGLVGTTVGLVLGHTVISVPFVVVTIMAVLKNYDTRLDQAAWSLGASKLRTLRHVTFPLILPGLIAAFLFAFVISLDELTIALFVSGGQTPTLPKQMWARRHLQAEPHGDRGLHRSPGLRHLAHPGRGVRKAPLREGDGIACPGRGVASSRGRRGGDAARNFDTDRFMSQERHNRAR